MKTRNPRLYRACGQHINASDDKCTDLAKHAFTMEEFENMKTRKIIPCDKYVEGCKHPQCNQPSEASEQSEHTPGPWKVRPADAISPDVIAITSNGVTVAFVPIEEIHNEQANARLIAAAPELLEVLKELHPKGVHSAEWGATKKGCRACETIAKATGGK